MGNSPNSLSQAILADWAYRVLYRTLLVLLGWGVRVESGALFERTLRSRARGAPRYAKSLYCTENLPVKIRWFKLSGKFPMDMRIPTLNIKIVLGSNPLKSIILVRGLAVLAGGCCGFDGEGGGGDEVITDGIGTPDPNPKHLVNRFFYRI